ncbi:transcription initiation factor TFIID subunit 13 [Diutina catenulata]
MYNTTQKIQNPLPRRRKKQRLFTREIANLQYGMGDIGDNDETTAALEDILQGYLQDLCHNMITYARSQGRSRVKMNDIAFALKDDPLKLARLEYILEQQVKIERAKRMLDDFGEQDEEEETEEEKKERKRRKREERKREKEVQKFK